MADIFSKEKRSWVMSKIKSKHTKAEKLLERKMMECGIKFKKYPKIFGSPDFLIGDNVLIFVDGCFWHKCPTHYREPRSRRSFWLPKIERNVKRDMLVTSKLKKYGYRVMRFWEHDVEKRSEYIIDKLLNELSNFI